MSFGDWARRRYRRFCGYREIPAEKERFRNRDFIGSVEQSNTSYAAETKALRIHAYRTDRIGKLTRISKARQPEIVRIVERFGEIDSRKYQVSNDQVTHTSITENPLRSAQPLSTIRISYCAVFPSAEKLRRRFLHTSLANSLNKLPRTLFPHQRISGQGA